MNIGVNVAKTIAIQKKKKKKKKNGIMMNVGVSAKN